jgi:hypothetical protein
VRGGGQADVDDTTEDFSDMVAGHAAQQAKKRKKASDGKATPSKKMKDFKF